MLSSIDDDEQLASGEQMSPWSRPYVVRSLTDVQETDIDDDRDAFMERLGMVLQEARKWAGFKQDKAAGSLSMSAATLGRWEHGANKVSAYDLIRLIRLYRFDATLAVEPPATRAAIRRALGPKPLRQSPDAGEIAAAVDSRLPEIEAEVRARGRIRSVPRADRPAPSPKRSSARAKQAT